MEGTLSLIAEAQAGSDDATRRLFTLIKDHHMPSFVGRYRGRNVLVGDADIESEFLLGCWQALPKTKLNIGNPLNFICWKGRMAVASMMKRRIRKEVRAQCLVCGWQGTLGWKAKVPVCRDCGSDDLWTWMVTSGDQSDSQAGIDSMIGNAASSNAEHVWQLAVYGIEIEELRDRLDGRARDLFDIIVTEGISRESSGNYLEEIAERWGVSTAAVASALRRLRKAVLEYVEA